MMAEVDLVEITAELYAVPPDEFIAVRDGHQQRARAAGDRGLAAQIGGLPKPTTAAWVCNLLVRRQADEIAQLVELGGLLREATRTLSGEQLRELNQQRHRVVAALTRQARSLAHAQGRPVSSSVAAQIEETLRAAVADAAAGQALLSGQLTSSLSYSGIGDVDVSTAVVGVPTPLRSRAERARSGRTDIDPEQAREQRRRQLEEARRDAADADTTAAQAVADAAAAQQAVGEIRSHREELQARIAELTQQLTRTEQAVATAARELADAEHRRAFAERRSANATAARDRARERVERLTRPASE